MGLRWVLLERRFSAAARATGVLASTSTADSPAASPLKRKSRRVIVLLSMIFLLFSRISGI
jgi:hypothetical protein